MSEAHSREVEKVLLYMADARDRARAAADRLERDGAQRHLVDALRDSVEELSEAHRRLAQGTYYAAPTSELKLAL
jgi:hypothetical protein